MKDVMVRIKIYEMDDCDVTCDNKMVVMTNHWNDTGFIEIQIDNGNKYTVGVKDLLSAIRSVTA